MRCFVPGLLFRCLKLHYDAFRPLLDNIQIPARIFLMFMAIGLKVGITDSIFRVIVGTYVTNVHKDCKKTAI